MDELCRMLAQQIPGERERETFLRACGKSGTGSRPGPSAISAQVLEEITRKLTRFMGPVAGIMVNRAARKAHNLEELYSMLAAEIPSDRDRAAFLSSRVG